MNDIKISNFEEFGKMLHYAFDLNRFLTISIDFQRKKKIL